MNQANIVRVFMRQRGTALVLLAGLLLAACSNGSAPTTTPTPGGNTPAASAPAVTATPGAHVAQDKIGKVFMQLLALYQTQGLTAATQYATDQGLLTTQGEVRVTLALDTSDADIVQGTGLSVGRLGGRVTTTYENKIELVMPAQALLEYGKRTNRTSFFHDLADFSHVKTIERTPLPSVGVTAVPGTKAAAATGGTTEGIAATAADRWQAAGITGNGVKVGIIDPSFTNYQQFLKGKVNTRTFRADGLMADKEADEESIHGTACAEIIQEMAPDAQIYLAAIDTIGGLYNAIDWLAHGAQVQVISISLGFTGTLPTNDTTALEREIDHAKRDAGVFFAIAAGNAGSGDIGSQSGSGHYGARFADTDQDSFHDFAGTAAKNGIRVHVNRDRPVRFVLNWDDWTDPHVNYDLYLYDAKGEEVIRSDDDQTKGFDPYEVIQTKLKAGDYTLKVKKANNGDPDLPFHLFFDGPQFEQITPMGSIANPASAKGAFAAGAFNVKTNLVEDYSSQGPTLDGRTKPDITAPDRTSGFAYASVGDADFPGTSAAAPHLAGAAVLYIEGFPDASPDAVFTYFAGHAKKPQGEPQGENITGAGYLFLDAVPQGAKTGPAPTVTATATKSAGTPITTPSSTRPRTTATATASRTATGTPALRTTPTATAAATGTAVFTDDYSSSSSGLPAAGYRNGEYHLSADANKLHFVTYPKAVGEVDYDAYEVTARRVSGASDLYMGIVLRAVDKDNYVLFAITNGGEYGFYVVDRGRMRAVSEPDTTETIKRDGANTIQVVGIGTSFTAVVNGQPVATAEIPSAPSSGAFGLLVSGTEKDGGEAAFDNFRVTVG